MASTQKIISIPSTAYVTSADSLTGNTWTLGENVLITFASLKASNKAADCFVNATFGTNGVIGTVQAVPDLADSTTKLVIRLSASDTLNAKLKTLLGATEIG
jgi:hypothetical protein